jgi:hypothetical protein
LPRTYGIQVKDDPPPATPLESLSHPPLELAQQGTAQVREARGRGVQGAQDCLSILNRETDNPLLGFE